VQITVQLLRHVHSNAGKNLVPENYDTLAGYRREKTVQCVITISPIHTKRLK